MSSASVTYFSDDKTRIKHIAELAALDITQDEGVKLSQQLDETLAYINNLKDLDNLVSQLEPSSQITGLENISREDEPSPSLSQDEALKNAKATQNGLFKVKGVLNND
ncbi:MAG: hypothetical protein A2798_02330 [Candidatus Levybacteria bacterium RIFCSPHIGHO2_01_FULL_37_17]|nr:MAG: hypothetical protein A2798_02330 [Candidatus Levybacteria bacterium RIFCSPHIGHO2_01_FULL_37_17]OGH36919.1 MAG: hypothetical protein A2959_00320 [Candidatus Levybacteria bacterium RIFCSPLOWO2_01_FULL_38_23]